MFVLGINGGIDLIDEYKYSTSQNIMHDSSAVLLKDGQVVFAIEEERLNRIKHTNKLPVCAIRACLASQHIRLSDVDIISYYIEGVDSWFKQVALDDPREPIVKDPHIFFQDLFQRACGEKVSPSVFRFVHHHHAHAMSAYALSGFPNSLCITMDGFGDYCSGIVLKTVGLKYKHLATLSALDSLGDYYLNIIRYLGYGNFDEYKVMGLAPYGNPNKYKKVFDSFFTLYPKGEYEIADTGVIAKAFSNITPRRKGEPFTQQHKDLAASLQASLEEIAFHIIKHYKRVTGAKNLCLAGGVAHNCTLNGKILESNLFDRVFVQPAAHDAGCSLGAALYSYYQTKPTSPPPAHLDHVYWGTPIESPDQLTNLLTKWSKFVDFKKQPDILSTTADLLAHDKVIGWVQGKSEFGPRALGNRSILADPRPATNKDRINKMIKKREGYRPFAPSVLLEETSNYFLVQPSWDELDYMNYVVKVRPSKRKLLGAITHVDGTARIQTVSKSTNPMYWDLINSFNKKTGIPILLNTSFNNHAEPIVDSALDAIVCFLTTGLDYLVIGDYLVWKKAFTSSAYLDLHLSIPAHVSLHSVKRQVNSKLKETYKLKVSYDPIFDVAIDSDLAKVLIHANSGQSLRTIFRFCKFNTQQAKLLTDLLMNLWSDRLIVLLA